MNSSRSSGLTGRPVLLLLNNFALGGAERQALRLASHLLHQQRAGVMVWGFAGPGPASVVCAEAGIPWRVVPFTWHGSRLKLLRELWRFSGALRRFRPHVVLPYLIWPNVVAGALWRFCGARGVIWQQRDLGIGSCPRRLTWFAVKNTPVFIANSRAGAEFLQRSFGVPRQKTRVVHNGVVLDAPQRDRVAWREALGVDPKCLAACMVANLSRHKDQATLLRAWRRVTNTWTLGEAEPVLILAGDDLGQRRQLEVLCGELGLRDVVRFAGQVRDVSGLWGAVDLCVYSSAREALPNGIIEAMMAGIPVVASDNTGCRECVGSGEGGVLVPAGDDVAFAEAIRGLLSDTSRRINLGAKGQRRAVAMFELERMCTETVEVIHQVTGEGGR